MNITWFARPHDAETLARIVIADYSRSSSVRRSRRPPNCRRRSRFSSIRYASTSRSRRSNQAVRASRRIWRARAFTSGSLHHGWQISLVATGRSGSGTERLRNPGRHHRFPQELGPLDLSANACLLGSCSTNRNEGRSCVFDCSHVELCLAGSHGDFPAEVRALLHHESRTYEIALDGASSTNLNLVTGRDAADDRAEDSNHLRNDVGLNVGVGTNSERVIGQVNSTLHPTINRQVFRSGQRPFYEHRTP
jgi:hypothetical protein